MNPYILAAIVTIIICIIIYCCYRSIKTLKVKAEALEILIKEEEQKLNKIHNQYNDYEKACQNELERKIVAQAEADSLEKYNADIKQQAEQFAKDYFDKAMANTTASLETALEKEAEKYREAQQEYEENYKQAMVDMANQAKEYGKTAQELLSSIDDLKSKQRAAIEANKRAAEEENKLNFYRIQIPSADIKEIKKLRGILPYLRDKDTLNKVIYKIYYENPANDLIGRVVGEKQSGIYKITNINNGMCYVGQAVNFANRWKQHIKRGVGAEAITHNKLYPAMQKEGIENFTFEIIEECPANKLNEREDYWQDYFGAKEYGYSIR